MPSLYEWAVEGSCLAISFLGPDAETHAAASVQAYKKMGSPLYLRDPREQLSVLGAWKPIAGGPMPATSWGDGNQAPCYEPIFVYGCICQKPVAVSRHITALAPAASAAGG